MSETTHSKSPSLVGRILRITATIFVGRVALGILGRLLYETGLLDISLAIFGVVLQVIIFIGWSVLMIYLTPNVMNHDESGVTHKQEQRKDTGDSTSESPADHLPNTDARQAYEFSDGRKIVPQSLAERDPIEAELEKERESEDQ